MHRIIFLDATHGQYAYLQSGEKLLSVLKGCPACDN